jgi:hypothetical protein
MEDIYNFYATYESTTATAQAPFYYVNIDGSVSYGNNVTVGPLRWIISVESKYGTPNVSYAREMRFFDDEEVTGIQPLSISPEGERTEAFPREGLDGVIYDLQGRRVAQPTKGMYIVRSAEGRLQGKSGKKIVIK